MKCREGQEWSQSLKVRREENEQGMEANKTRQVSDIQAAGFCQEPCARGDECPIALILHKHANKHAFFPAQPQLAVLFLYQRNEYFITSNINMHSNGFAHSYYRYFLLLLLFLPPSDQKKKK